MIDPKAKLENRKKLRRSMINGILGGLILSIAYYIIKKDIPISIILVFVPMFILMTLRLIKKVMEKSSKKKKMETVFPDFLQLVASNLRAGMTIDKAMLLSAREEFNPLDEEIISIGKEIATGKEVEKALLDMAKRIESEKITKTILLLISGIKSGGDIAILLEKTAVGLKEKIFVEKKASSNVLMYTIFIFFAVSCGAPILFSLSTILIETLIGITSGMPMVQSSASLNIPFSFTGINISVTFIKYFCLVFMFALNILSSFILGLVSKGDEKEGLKYIVPLMMISYSVFFIVRWLLSGFIGSLM